jgi:hypothetical protein
MNEYERLISSDAPTVSSQTYSYDGKALDANTLLFCIFTEEVCKYFGINDYDGVIAIVMILVGHPFIPTRGKPGGATKGTSIASLVLRAVLNINFKKAILPTVTTSSFKGGQFFRWTRNLGAFVGRWIPWIGAALGVYDVIKINFMTLYRYNQLVSDEDRINDATIGSFG